MPIHKDHSRTLCRGTTGTADEADRVTVEYALAPLNIGLATDHPSSSSESTNVEHARMGTATSTMLVMVQTSGTVYLQVRRSLVSHRSGSVT